MAKPLICIKNLSVRFSTPKGIVHAAQGVDLTIQRNEILALAGESGSGKTVTAMSIPRLLSNNALPPEGSILFDGVEILNLSETAMRKIRGKRISVIFQDPMNSMNPLHSIEKQISESIALHHSISKKEIRSRVIELLHAVGLPEAESRLGDYPHMFSGGQRQRIMIAMALANAPDLLIADEPTTALDVAIQTQILDLLKDIQSRTQMSILLITHDLGSVGRIADKIAVMKNGVIVETGAASDILKNPKHPYTKRLVLTEYAKTPLNSDAGAPEILTGENISVDFPVRKGFLRRTAGNISAVKNVSVAIRRGQTVGVVGESGSGKTTLGMALLRLEKSKGLIRFIGNEIHDISPKAVRQLRKNMQPVFQDSCGALNPSMTVEEIIGEGLRIHYPETRRDKRRDTIVNTLSDVGLSAEILSRLPHELSGGQCRRVALARALSLKPDLLVLDEPTSSLDRLLQTQLVELLINIQKTYGIAYMFISHDMEVVRALSHYIFVMRYGQIVEQGSAREIFENPKDSYTKTLVAASRLTAAVARC